MAFVGVGGWVCDNVLRWRFAVGVGVYVGVWVCVWVCVFVSAVQSIFCLSVIFGNQLTTFLAIVPTYNS